MSSRWDPDVMDAMGVQLVDGLSAQSIGGITAKAEAQNIEDPPDWKVSGDGKVSVSNLGPLAAARIQKYMQLGAQTESFLQQMAQQAMKKREILEKNPLIATIGRASSAIAAQYAAPGSRGQALVRGLGAFGADYFEDTPESLIAKAAAASSQAMESEGKIIDVLANEERQRLNAQMEKRRMAAEDRMATQGEERLKLEKADQKRKAQNDVYGIFEQAARINRADTSEAFRAEAKSSGLFTDGEIEAKAKSLKVLGESSANAWDRDKALDHERTMIEINFRRSEAAKDRAAASGNARTDRILGRIDKTEAQKKEVVEDYVTAKSYFTDMADELGLPPPTTQAEAQKVLAEARKNPLHRERWRSLSEMAPRRLAQFDLSSLETLKKQQAMYESQLPPELRPGLNKPATATEVVPQPGAPPTALELRVKAMRDGGEIDEARARTMIAALEKGVIPDELRPNKSALGKAWDWVSQPSIAKKAASAPARTPVATAAATQPAPAPTPAVAARASVWERAWNQAEMKSTRGPLDSGSKATLKELAAGIEWPEKGPIKTFEGAIEKLIEAANVYPELREYLATVEKPKYGPVELLNRLLEGKPLR